MDLCHLLSYGNPNESTFGNRIILEATITIIKLLDVSIKRSGKQQPMFCFFLFFSIYC